MYLYGLVNNAGMMAPGILELQTEQEVKQTFDGILCQCWYLSTPNLGYSSKCCGNMENMQSFLAIAETGEED